MDAPQPSEPEVQSPPVVPAQRRPGARRSDPPPSAPAPSAPPPSGPAPSSPPQPSSRHRGRLRRILLVALLTVGFGSVGAVGYGFIWYDQATKPNRGTPTASAGSFLGALLIERDESRAALFTCAAADLNEIRQFRSEIEAREQRLRVGISVNVGDLRVERQSGGEAAVLATVRRSATVDGVPQSVTDRWRLRVEDRDGWRVCAARKMP